MVSLLQLPGAQLLASDSLAFTVPVKLIPFLIVVLGVDNMFVLTTAVTNTSINLPVKERIAEGLAQSGVGIFLNLVMELSVCGIVYAAIQAAVIREMAVFSAVALVVDYIMEMTYFITVLSIDMHRLELADFLSQGSGTISPGGAKNGEGTAALPRFLEIMVNSVQDRQARTYTAVILIGSNYLLYLLYGADYFVPAFCSNIQHAQAFKLPIDSLRTPSGILWQMLGARQSEAIHVHTPLPIVLFFDSFNTSTNFYTFAKAWALAGFKFVVLPISLTTFALYLFLVQLLKGTDQRQSSYENGSMQNKAAHTEFEEEKQRPELQVSTPMYNPGDVEILGMSSNGNFCATWVPLERSIRLWSFPDSQQASRQTQLPFGNHIKAGDGVTHLAVSDDGTRIAASTSSRRIIVWQSTNGSTPACLSEAFTQTRSKIVSVISEPPRNTMRSPPRAAGHRSPKDSLQPAFLSLHEDGSVWRWQCFGEEPRRLFAPVSDAKQAMFATSRSGVSDKILVRLSGASEEVVNAWRFSPATGEWRFMASFWLETATGSISALEVRQEEETSLMAIGRSTGFVEVYHLELEKQVFVSKLHEASVRQLRLRNVPSMQCPICRSSIANAMILASSDSTVLFLTRLQTSKSDSCDCEPGISGQMATFPSVFSHTSSPSRKAPSPQAVQDDSSKSLAYPLSPHAFRRLSHAADRRKADDSPRRTGDVISSMADLGSPPPKNHGKVPSEIRLPGISGDAEDVAWGFVHLGSVALDLRDRWDICASQLVGLRKAHRRDGYSVSSALNRWEAWSCLLPTLKLAANGSFALRSSPINQLMTSSAEDGGENDPSKLQLPFNRVRHFKVAKDGSSVIASFGNMVCKFSLQPETVSMTRKLSLEYK